MQLLMIAAAAAQTFNLACSGTLTSTSFFSGTKSEPYSSLYRIDLSAGRYCENECKGMFTVASTQPTSLVLQHTETDTPSDKSSLSNTINRETGAHHVLALSKNPRDRTSTLILEWKGQCVRQPFTGFPTFETKF